MLKLRSALRQKRHDVKPKHHVKPTTTKSSARAAARVAYGTSVERQLRYGQVSNNSPSTLDHTAVEAHAALKELIELGYFAPPTCGSLGCPHCGSALGPPRPASGDGKLYYRCCAYACNKRINATDLSPFRGARLTLASLLWIITFSARSNCTLSPLVAEATSQLGLKRTAVENMCNTRRSRESAAGMQFSKAKALAGNVEGQALCDVS